MRLSDSERTEVRRPECIPACAVHDQLMKAYCSGRTVTRYKCEVAGCTVSATVHRKVVPIVFYTSDGSLPGRNGRHAP